MQPRLPLFPEPSCLPDILFSLACFSSYSAVRGTVSRVPGVAPLPKLLPQELRLAEPLLAHRTAITKLRFIYVVVRDHQREGPSCPAADSSRARCSSQRKAPLLISQHRSCGAAAQTGHGTDNLCWGVRFLICIERPLFLEYRNLLVSSLPT